MSALGRHNEKGYRAEGQWVVVGDSEGGPTSAACLHLDQALVSEPATWGRAKTVCGKEPAGFTSVCA